MILKEEEIKLIEKLLYNANSIKINYHEMNHIFYDLLYIHSNGINPVKTHIKKHRIVNLYFQILLWLLKIIIMMLKTSENLIISIDELNSIVKGKKLNYHTFVIKLTNAQKEKRSN